jgi:hypothetical protein
VSVVLGCLGALARPVPLVLLALAAASWLFTLRVADAPDHLGLGLDP